MKYDERFTPEKPSLAVAPITFRMVLLIYSYQFRSAFLPPRSASRLSRYCDERVLLPIFVYTFSRKGTFSHVTLNFDL